MQNYHDGAVTRVTLKTRAAAWAAVSNFLYRATFCDARHVTAHSIRQYCSPDADLIARLAGFQLRRVSLLVALSGHPEHSSRALKYCPPSGVISILKPLDKLCEEAFTHKIARSASRFLRKCVRLRHMFHRRSSNPALALGRTTLRLIITSGALRLLQRCDAFFNSRKAAF
jgi:hypothetical protein